MIYSLGRYSCWIQLEIGNRSIRYNRKHTKNDLYVPCCCLLVLLSYHSFCFVVFDSISLPIWLINFTSVEPQGITESFLCTKASLSQAMFSKRTHFMRSSKISYGNKARFIWLVRSISLPWLSNLSRAWRLQTLNLKCPFSSCPRHWRMLCWQRVPPECCMSQYQRILQLHLYRWIWRRREKLHG